MSLQYNTTLCKVDIISPPSSPRRELAAGLRPRKGHADAKVAELRSPAVELWRTVSFN